MYHSNIMKSKEETMRECNHNKLIRNCDVVFISPYWDIHCINVRRLSAFLKDNGFSTKIIFLPQPSDKKYSNNVLSQIANLCKDSKLIAISLMTNNFYNAVQLTDHLKKLNIPIIWGGTHPTVMPDECLSKVDMICVGEGEETLLSIMKKVPIAEIPNLFYKKNSEIIKNKLKSFEEIDFIKLPDYDIDDHYILFGDKIHKMDNYLFRNFYGKSYRIHCTFGCPNKCSYCCNNVYNKLIKFKFRKRKISNIINELIIVKSKFPFLNRIDIYDDYFFCYTIDELNEFKKSYLKFVNIPLFIRGGHPASIKKDSLKICYDTGMTTIGMGIQTGSENIKKLYNREVSNDVILNACNIINSFPNLNANYDIILDNPWEKEQDIIDTLYLVLKIPPGKYRLQLFTLTFYPGTELFKKGLEEGMIKDIDYHLHFKHFENLENTYLNLLFLVIPNKLPYSLNVWLIHQNKTRWKPILRACLLGYRKYLTFKLSLISLFGGYRDFSFYIRKIYYDRIGERFVKRKSL